MPYIRNSANQNPVQQANLSQGVYFGDPDASPSTVAAALSGVPNPIPSSQQQQQPQQQPGFQVRPGSAQYPEYIMKRKRIAQQYGWDYQPNDEDIKYMEFQRYKETFKSSLWRQMLLMRRIKHRHPTDPEAKEYLIYKYEDTIYDDAKKPRHLAAYEGLEMEPIPDVRLNALREVEHVSFDKNKVTYTILWSREVAEAAVAMAVNIPTDMAVAYGSEFGPKDPWHGNELTVHNYQEFLEFSFDDLERANQGGFLSKKYGGVQQMFEQEELEAKKEQEQGPNMFPSMPNIQQMEEDLRKAKALAARMKRQQQTEARDQQKETKIIQDAKVEQQQQQQEEEKTE